MASFLDITIMKMDLLRLRMIREIILFSIYYFNIVKFPHLDSKHPQQASLWSLHLTNLLQYVEYVIVDFNNRHVALTHKTRLQVQ